MREQSIPEAIIEQIVWQNPVTFFAQSGRLDLAELDKRPAIDRASTFETNTILRGEPVRTR
jgi:hypothetical protein